MPSRTDCKSTDKHCRGFYCKTTVFAGISTAITMYVVQGCKFEHLHTQITEHINSYQHTNIHKHVAFESLPET